MVINFSLESVDREVERLFREHPPVYGKLCVNPVHGGLYVGGIDPIQPQKEAARRRLLAREWFRLHGPADAQPLPVSDGERSKMKARCTLFHYIVALYARSLDSRNYNFDEHPPFGDYVSGVLWDAQRVDEPLHGELPNYPNELPQLTKRFPPRRLPGLLPSFSWVPAKKYAEMIKDIRRYRSGQLQS